MSRLKVKDDPFLCRDPQSNGIINTNDVAYNEYLKRKRKAQHLEEEKHNAETRLNKLEQDVSELKDGISQILELLRK
jgi:wobble nucleotide-excising tRNase